MLMYIIKKYNSTLFHSCEKEKSIISSVYVKNTAKYTTLFTTINREIAPQNKVSVPVATFHSQIKNHMLAI